MSYPLPIITRMRQTFASANIASRRGVRALRAAFWPIQRVQSQHFDTLRTRLDTLRHNKKNSPQLPKAKNVDSCPTISTSFKACTSFVQLCTSLYKIKNFPLKKCDIQMLTLLPTRNFIRRHSNPAVDCGWEAESTFGYRIF